MLLLRSISVLVIESYCCVDVLLKPFSVIVRKKTHPSIGALEWKPVVKNFVTL